MNIQEAAAALRARKISSVEMVEESLKRTARDRLNAFITVTAEAARAEAKERDAELARGVDRGPLHGIPIAHKDLIQTRGVRTTAGSKILADFIPDEDAVVAARLREAGAISIGKTGLHELAYGITSTNPHFGAVRNPWDPERIPGGSSGGSGAAVAADLVFMATGTDTGGSIRIPSSFCGTVGLKPTYERVSRRGVIPLSMTMDHIGPMTRTVRDTAICFQAMAENASGYVPAGQAELGGLRIGVPRNFYFDSLDAEVAAAVRGAIQTAAAIGGRVVEVTVPDINAINAAGRVLLLVEAAANWRPHLNRRGDFGADVLALLDQGRLILGIDYADALRLRRIYAREFSRVWSKADCLIVPATPAAAPKIGEMTVDIAGKRDDVRMISTRLMRAVNMLGVPSLAMPCGFTRSRLPIGMQILGPARSEDTLLRIGAAIEDALGLAESLKLS
ncbi:MAG TPA: amidase [Bryobacteraceae bacterium]|nr:amidase [Bryobacteraceae bacterium]